MELAKKLDNFSLKVKRMHFSTLISYFLHTNIFSDSILEPDVNSTTDENLDLWQQNIKENM